MPSFPQPIILIVIFFFDCCFSPSTADGPMLSSAPRPLHMLLKNRISRIFPSHLHCPLLVFIQEKKKEDNETDCDKSRQILYANRSTYCELVLARMIQNQPLFALTPSRGQAAVTHRTPKTPLLTKPFFDLEKKLCFPASFCCARPQKSH